MIARAPRGFSTWRLAAGAAALLAVLAPPARAEGEGASASATPQAADSATAASAPDASREDLPDIKFALDFLSGWQGSSTVEDSAFFLKYQEIGDPVVLPRLVMRVRSWDTEFRLDMVDAAEDDAIYRFGVRRPGFFAASIGYDEIPNRLSQSASTLYSLSGGNRLLISDKIQTTLQGASFRLAEFLKGNAHPVDIETNRKTLRAKGSISPIPGLTLSVSEEEEKRRGNLSRSISTNFANGADSYEFPDPVHYDTRRAGVGIEYRFGPTWISFDAGFTRFTNRADHLLVDNPLRIDDALGGAFGNRSARRFLVSTPPDNKARDFSASAGLALPLGMRVTGTFARGRITAPADMNEFTSNTAALVNPFYPRLPSDTINAKVKTSRYDFAFTGTPLRWLSFRAFARGYEYDNQTTLYLFRGYVIADTQLSILDRRTVPYGWERKGQGIDLRARPLTGLNIGLGFERESVDRTFREVENSDENLIRASVDYSLMQWLEIRGDVAKSERRADHYDARAYERTYPDGVPGDQVQFRLLKRFDVASRDRSELGIAGAIDFGSGWGFDFASRQRTDDYLESNYGLVDEGTRSKIAGLTMKPNTPCEVRLEIADEFRTRRVNSRYRPLVSGAPVDARSNDWSDEISSKMHTTTGGVVCRDDDDRWDFNIRGESSTDRQTDDAAFAGKGVSDPFGRGHALDHADIKRELQRYTGVVRFELSRHLNMVLSGLYEKLVENDPTQDLMVPTMAGTDPAAFESAFLGVHYEGYSVRVFAILLDAHW